MSANALRVSVLGPITATRDGDPLRLGGRMQRALLAALVARHPVHVSTLRISDDLWGDEQPPSAQGTIYAYVSRLRKALGSDVIVKDGDGYRLDLPAAALDVSAFAEMIQLAASSSVAAPAEAVATYRAALELWRGDPYGDLGHEPFLLAERGRLVELRASALEGYLASRLDADGSDASLVAEIEAALDEFPLRERLWHSLMLAMYRQGRQADALRAYQRAAAVLGEELGVEPGPDLRELEGQVLRQHPGLHERVRDEQRRAHLPCPTNLRPAPTSFVGRERLVHQVLGDLREHRMVTLLGPGGVGKTRLAVEVGVHASSDHPGGVWDIDLLREVDSSVTVPRLAEAIGLPSPSRQDALDRIARHLADRPALIVLDNCEHLVPGLASQVAEVLRACPGVSIVATSQVSVDVGDEHLIRVPPLSHAPQNASAEEAAREPAFRLFVDRVRQTKPGYQAFGADVAAVRQIVSLLDGLPLAIEIAASQAALLPITEIAERIGGGAASALVGTSHDPRHGTLEVLVDWGVGRLPPVLRERLAEACVFAGPFGADSAAAVWGVEESDAASDLDVLRARSLIEEIPPSEYAGTRYRALESVRQHGRRRLTVAQRATEVRLRHARWVAGLVAAAAEHYHDGEQAAWFDRLRLERAEVEPALLALEDDRERWRRLVTDLWYWYYVDGNLDDALRLLQQAIDDEPDAVLVGAWALVYASQADADTEVAAAAARRAAGLAAELGSDHADEAALATLLAGDALTSIAYMEEAEPYLIDAASRFRELGVDWGIGWAMLRRLRVESLGRGHPDVAEALHIEAMAHLEAAGDSSLLAYSHIVLASRERLRNRYQESLDHGLRALKALEQLGSGADTAEATYWVVNALVHLERFEEARDRLPDLARLCTASGTWPADSVQMLEGLMAKLSGDLASAIEIYQHLVAAAEAAGDGWAVARCLLELAEAYERAGDLPAADDAVQRGMPLWEQFESPWFPARLKVVAGEVALGWERHETARALFDEAVEQTGAMHQYLWLARAHEGLAECGRRSGDLVSAIVHLASAGTIRDAIGSHPDPQRRTQLRELAARLRDAVGAAQFDREWAAASERALDTVLPAIQIS